LWKHSCALVNFGFAAVFAAPKHTGLQHQGRIVGKGQCYSKPKFGLSEVNHSAGVRPPSMMMLQQNCCVLRQRLTKVVVVGTYGVKFQEYPHASFKTIFWALNYEIKKLF
jgi:hypothetical protein